jgi:alpha-L-rhamnosidase
VRCTDLRCERLADPIGLDVRAPRLTWRLEPDAGETGVVQHACQVDVDGLWDTGRVEGWRQQVTYDGPALASGAVVRWRVRAWTSAGDTDWSAWATFETGILDPGEWVATMITAPTSSPVARFTRRVAVRDGLVRARLRVTAHGVLSASIDGIDVSDDVLTPGWTSYHHRLLVSTSDVTALLHPGENELAVLVAPGWFSGRLGFEGKRHLYGDHVGVFAQLELGYATARARRSAPTSRGKPPRRPTGSPSCTTVRRMTPACPQWETPRRCRCSPGSTAACCARPPPRRCDARRWFRLCREAARSSTSGRTSSAGYA